MSSILHHAFPQRSDLLFAFSYDPRPAAHSATTSTTTNATASGELLSVGASCSTALY